MALRIAVCIRGEFRHWDIARQNIFNAFSETEHEIDFFVTTWDSTPHFYFNEEHTEISTVHKPVTPETFVSDFSDAGANLANYQILPSVKFDKECEELNGQDLHMYIMFTQWYRCNQLKKQYEIDNNITYDYVICLRPDVLLYSEAIKSYYLDEITKVPEMSIVTDIPLMAYSIYNSIDSRNLFRFFAGDNFIAGRSKTIDIICDAYIFALRTHTKYNKPLTNGTGHWILISQMFKHHIYSYNLFYDFAPESHDTSDMPIILMKPCVRLLKDELSKCREFRLSEIRDDLNKWGRLSRTLYWAGDAMFLYNAIEGTYTRVELE